MESKFDISVFIENLGEDLITIFDRSSKLGIHPDEVGKLKEVNIAKQIEAILPSGVGIGRGYVIDSYGNISNQCDLILYEKNYIPVFVRNDNIEYSYYPCEGVIAVGEIKSTLNISELQTSLKKLNKIKKMQRVCKDSHNFRRYLSPLIGYGADSERFDPIEKGYDNIFTFIFCRDNVISEDTILENLINEYRGCMELGIDRIYSFNKSIVSRLSYYDGKSYLCGNKKSIGFCTLNVNAKAFGVLAKDVSDFVQQGRSQKFSFENYYKIGDILIKQHKTI